MKTEGDRFAKAVLKRRLILPLPPPLPTPPCPPPPPSYPPTKPSWTEPALRPAKKDVFSACRLLSPYSGSDAVSGGMRALVNVLSHAANQLGALLSRPCKRTQSCCDALVHPFFSSTSPRPSPTTPPPHHHPPPTTHPSDTLDHSILLERLHTAFGILWLSPSVVKIMRLFVLDRVQVLVVDNITSTLRRPLFGVPPSGINVSGPWSVFGIPQGSVFGVPGQCLGFRRDRCLGSLKDQCLGFLISVLDPSGISVWGP